MVQECGMKSQENVLQNSEWSRMPSILFSRRRRSEYTVLDIYDEPGGQFFLEAT